MCAAGAPRPLFASQRDYLLALASHVQELAEGRPTLTDAARKQLEERMTALYPGAGLTFLIAMNGGTPSGEPDRRLFSVRQARGRDRLTVALLVLARHS